MDEQRETKRWRALQKANWVGRLGRARQESVWAVWVYGEGREPAVEINKV